MSQDISKIYFFFLLVRPKPTLPFKYLKSFKKRINKNEKTVTDEIPVRLIRVIKQFDFKKVFLLRRTKTRRPTLIFLIHGVKENRKHVYRSNTFNGREKKEKRKFKNTLIGIYRKYNI